ncbi:MAG: nuclear transport factor 2 family protein [Alphaproteobacteria bacterium]
MSEHAALLFANDAFYVAFSTGDVEAMEALWSASPQITCTHPGWDTLNGRDEVLDSWHAIMDNSDALNISCFHASAHVLGDVGYVVCYEKTSGVALAATNLFVRENGGWKMFHHQSGPAPALFEDDDDDDPLDTMQ